MTEIDCKRLANLVSHRKSLFSTTFLESTEFSMLSVGLFPGASEAQL